MKHDIYKYLGLSIFNENLYISINESIKEHYNIINNITLYNCNYEKLALDTSNKMFNNSHKLIKLIKKKYRIETHGFIYKGLIKHKSKKYYTNLFIKEIPIISVKSKVESINENILSHSQFSIYNQMYNTNSSPNIEIFTSYIVSRISELDLSPSFCKIYGCYTANMLKYTYIEDNDKSDKSIKKWKFNIKYSDYEDLYIEKNNIPVYLLALEKTDYDIDFFKSLNDSIDINVLRSILFQIFSAIFTIYNLFGIKHNDLHIGNIMLSNTKLEFLYYNYDSKYYKIPTYGFIVKIIDWGRATYKFNGSEGRNTLFNRGGICNGQYQYTLPNKPCMGDFYKNKWSDIVLISHSFLHNFPDIKNYKEIFNLLKNILKTKTNLYVSTKEFNWDIYEFIGRSNFNIKPRNILSHKIFKSYKINLKNISKNEKIYKIYL